ARDLAMERAALVRCLNWAGQYTSHVHSDFGNHVLLEISGSLRLFGGLSALRTKIAEGFASLGYEACIAVAPTPRAALWLSRAGQAVTVSAIKNLSAHLGALPLAATAWPDKVCRNLRDLGLRQLGDCLRLPRNGFGRRIGKAYLQELDQALGREHDPRTAWQPPEYYCGRMELPMPVSKHDWLLHAIGRLLRELSGFLRAREAGIRRLQLYLQHEDAAATRCVLHLLHEERDAQRLLELLSERLHREVLPAPVVAVRIRSDALRVLRRAPEQLFGQRERKAGVSMTADMLVERLRARLGGEAVHGLCLVPEHRPESAWQVSEPGRDSDALRVKERPFWLLDSPRRLPIRAHQPWLDGPLSVESGPERIETGWWDGKDVARDYFRMRTHGGICLWVFRERRGTRAWFLHGVFA
ncbi:MAG: DNA polymerase Y family protein, partial [Gammaproteobacteria bacterium]|nr:DNA polymerase Y family protein [Gammaproteobacteria bacterium]